MQFPNVLQNKYSLELRAEGMKRYIRVACNSILILMVIIIIMQSSFIIYDRQSSVLYTLSCSVLKTRQARKWIFKKTT